MPAQRALTLRRYLDGEVFRRIRLGVGSLSRLPNAHRDLCSFGHNPSSDGAARVAEKGSRMVALLFYSNQHTLQSQHSMLVCISLWFQRIF